MRGLIAVAAMGVGALTARRLLGVRQAAAGIPAELRSPLAELYSLPYSAQTLPVIRTMFKLAPVRPGPGVTVTRQCVGAPDVPGLVVTSMTVRERRPAVLWLHPGGMVVGTPAVGTPTMGLLVRELDAVVVSPDYRLAPEHPYPAAIDDCMATLLWMREKADVLGVDPNRIAVGGSSAGGGLAAAVAQRSHDERISLRAQVLVYPMLDDRTTLRTDHGGRGRFVWTPAANRFAWTAYLGHEPRLSDAPQYSAPARRADLTGLPPAWIGVGERDLFHDEDVAYAEQVKASGVPCQLVVVAGMYHGADGFAPKAASIQDFRRSMVDFLRRHL